MSERKDVFDVIIEHAKPTPEDELFKDILESGTDFNTKEAYAFLIEYVQRCKLIFKYPLDDIEQSLIMAQEKAPSKTDNETLEFLKRSYFNDIQNSIPKNSIFFITFTGEECSMQYIPKRIHRKLLGHKYAVMNIAYNANGWKGFSTLYCHVPDMLDDWIKRISEEFTDSIGAKECLEVLYEMRRAAFKPNPEDYDEITAIVIQDDPKKINERGADSPKRIQGT